MARIVIIGLDQSAEAVDIDGRVTIGRQPDNNLVLTDEVVSRHHAMLQPEGSKYSLVDLGSANGTFLNNKPVNTPVNIGHGDEIRLGDSVLRFYYAELDDETEIKSDMDSTVRMFDPVTISVLVTDVRKYTHLSESIPAQVLSQYIAQWFELAGNCIQNNGGTIEHYRGDSVAAYWLADSGSKDSNEFVFQAVKTAKDLVRQVRRIDEKFSLKFSDKSFRIGCSIHVGEAIMCNIGTDSRRDLTFIGDPINVAYRIEALCSVLGKNILISEQVNQALKSQTITLDLGLHTIKGKTEKLHIYAVE